MTYKKKFWLLIAIVLLWSCIPIVVKMLFDVVLLHSWYTVIHIGVSMVLGWFIGTCAVKAWPRREKQW